MRRKKTHPNCGFINVHGQVADDDLVRIPRCLAERRNGLLLDASCDGNVTGVSSTSATCSGCGTSSLSTGTTTLGVLVRGLAAGDELFEAERVKAGERGGMDVRPCFGIHWLNKGEAIASRSADLRGKRLRTSSSPLSMSMAMADMLVKC